MCGWNKVSFASKRVFGEGKFRRRRHDRLVCPGLGINIRELPYRQGISPLDGSQIQNEEAANVRVLDLSRVFQIEIIAY
jgi:hypothetical protein